MAFREDRRAAAVQVGAVLLLGFLVIGLSLYQATVVPEGNERAEFAHSRQVQDDMLDLRNAVLRTGTGGTVQPVAIDMGADYETRVFFVNPPPPGGRLQSESGGTIVVENATATDDETDDFLNATANGPYELATRNVSYSPEYNVYRSAPTTAYRTGVTENEFESGTATAISGQPIVDGNEIYLVALTGNVSRAGTRSLALDPRSLSTATGTTTIEDTAAGNVTIVVPSSLSAGRWEALLGDEFDPDDGSDDHHVVDVSNASGGVRLELDGDETYRLRTALVGVGTGAERPDAAYLTRVGPRNVTPLAGEELVVEVRDRYNNPIDPTATGDLRVEVTDGSDLVRTDEVAVDDDGRARFTYDGTGEFEGRELTVGVVGRSGEGWEATFDVTDLGGGGGGGSGSIDLVAGSGTAANEEGDAKAETVSFALRNGRTGDVDATAIAVDATSGSATRVRFVAGGHEVTTDRTGFVDRELRIGGPSESFRAPAPLPAGEETAFTVKRFGTSGGPGSGSDVDMAGESVTVTVSFSDGTQETYAFTAS